METKLDDFLSLLVLAHKRTGETLARLEGECELETSQPLKDAYNRISGKQEAYYDCIGLLKYGINRFKV